MTKSSVVKKFDALVSKYGFDQHTLVDMYDIEHEKEMIEHMLYLIPDAHVERRARKTVETDEGEMTAYGAVVVNSTLSD